MNVALLVISLIIFTIHKVGWAKKFNHPRSFYWSRTHVIPLSSRGSHIGPVPLINEVTQEWSNWSSWKICSRTCGGGITSRTRLCIAKSTRVMPGSGIRTTHSRCTGDSLQHKICGSNTCPAGEASTVSFKANQCRSYNNRKVLGKIVNNWIPYNQGGLNPCALVCEGKDEGIIYTFGKVTDSTFCNIDRGQKGLCVNGRCMKLACDGRLGGNTEEDMCRICGGANETCTKYSGSYYSEFPLADQPTPGYAASKINTFGYIEVTEIPRGSTNVKVSDNSSNFIALRSKKKYLLNGNWLIDWPGDIEAAGATFSYSRKEDKSEMLATLGPTHEVLVLMVLLKENNPEIYYEYWLPNHIRSEKSFISPKPVHHNLKSSSRVFESQSSIRINKTDTFRQYKNNKKPRNLQVLNFKSIATNQVVGKHKINLINEIFPHTKRKTKMKKQYKKSKLKVRKKKNCQPCKKIRAKKSFCNSDFVSNVRIIGKKRMANQSRLEVIVLQSYKNLIPLLHKEFLWQDSCPCRILRPNRTYVIMGMTGHGKGREVRLVLNRNSYIRKYSSKVLSRMTWLRKNEMSLCRRWRKHLGKHRLLSRNFDKVSSLIAGDSPTR